MKNSMTSKMKLKETSGWFLTPFLMLIMNPSHVLAQSFDKQGQTVDGRGGRGYFVGDGESVTYKNGNFTNFYTSGLIPTLGALVSPPR